VWVDPHQQRVVSHLGTPAASGGESSGAIGTWQEKKASNKTNDLAVLWGAAHPFQQVWPSVHPKLTFLSCSPVNKLCLLALSHHAALTILTLTVALLLSMTMMAKQCQNKRQKVEGRKK